MRKEIENWIKQGKEEFNTAEIIGYWNSPIDLEPLCYTPKEFKRNRNS